MAKHLLEGRGLPVFFYGQHYGLSAFESLFGAAGFLLAGVCDAALKWAMLPLWALGWMFAVLHVRRWVGASGAVLAGAFLLTCPAWALWSMKARGGYLTAFALAHVAALVADAVAERRPNRLWHAGCTGICVGLVFWAQPIWLPGLAPFTLPILLRTPWRTGWLPVVAAAMVTAACVWLASRGPHEGYWSPSLFAAPHVVAAIERLPWAMWVHFTGAYAYTTTLPAGPISAAAAGTWCVVVAAALLDLLRSKQSRGHPGSDFRRRCAWAMTATIGVSLLISPGAFQFRYLLPLSAYAAAWLASALAAAWSAVTIPRWLTAAACGFMLLAGAGGLHALRELRGLVVLPGGRVVSLSEVTALVDQLEREGVRHVYCLDPMLQWHILFESRERVTARWWSATDRVPAYPRAVDAALRRGEPVALVGLSADVEDLNRFLDETHYPGARAERVTPGFFVLEAPTPELLHTLQFRQTPADALTQESGTTSGSLPRTSSP